MLKLSSCPITTVKTDGKKKAKYWTEQNKFQVIPRKNNFNSFGFLVLFCIIFLLQHCGTCVSQYIHLVFFYIFFSVIFPTNSKAVFKRLILFSFRAHKLNDTYSIGKLTTHRPLLLFTIHIFSSFFFVCFFFQFLLFVIWLTLQSKSFSTILFVSENPSFNLIHLGLSPFKFWSCFFSSSQKLKLMHAECRMVDDVWNNKIEFSSIEMTYLLFIHFEYFCLFIFFFFLKYTNYEPRIRILQIGFGIDLKWTAWMHNESYFFANLLWPRECFDIQSEAAELLVNLHESEAFLILLIGSNLDPKFEFQTIHIIIWSHQHKNAFLK